MGFGFGVVGVSNGCVASFSPETVRRLRDVAAARRALSMAELAIATAADACPRDISSIAEDGLYYGVVEVNMEGVFIVSSFSMVSSRGGSGSLDNFLAKPRK